MKHVHPGVSQVRKPAEQSSVDFGYAFKAVYSLEITVEGLLNYGLHSLRDLSSTITSHMQNKETSHNSSIKSVGSCHSRCRLASGLGSNLCSFTSGPFAKNVAHMKESSKTVHRVSLAMVS